MVVSAAIAWVTIIVTMALFESSMIYFPDRYPVGFWDVEAVSRASGTTIHDCDLTTADGVRLHGWWCRPDSVDETATTTADMVLLYFHGNAGNLSQRADAVVELARMPVQVFILDYRGYGRSVGRPSERGLYLDARAAWHYLVDDNGIEPERIIILGKSLGGAVAVDLATEVEPAGLILQSTFTSIPDMAAHHYPFIPRWLIRTKMDSLSKIGRIACPVLVIHSTGDEVAPIAMGRRLLDAAGAEAWWLEIEGAAHNEVSVVGGTAYFEAIRIFIESCQSRTGGRR
jgi:fermentation-respiration switch protein FrsA (DUF1100 family)